MSETKEVKIYSAPDNIQAEMVLEVFKNNQIPAYKKGIGASGIMNIYGGNSMFGENIFVAEEDAEKAEQILIEMGLLEE